MATMKLTMKRTDLIKKVKKNKEAARKRHEERFGGDTYEKQMEQYNKELVQYQKNLVAHLTKVSKAYADVAKRVGTMNRDNLATYRRFEDLYDIRRGFPQAPYKPSKLDAREFDPSGYDEVIEMLSLATDETLTVSGVEYDAWLNGALGRTRTRRR